MSARRRQTDPVALATVGLVAALALPLLVPGLSSEARAFYSDALSSAPLLVLAIVLMQRGRAGVELGERSFWNLLTVSTGFWLVQQLVLGATYSLEDSLPLSLTQDLLYTASYLFVVLALDARPHLRLGAEERRGLAALRRGGAFAFVLGLVVYLLWVPIAADPESYWAGAPSFSLYVVLDGYFVLRLLAARRESTARRWRAAYGWLLASYAAWTVLDAVEGLMWAGTLPDTGSGSPWDLFWFVPLIALVMAARTRTKVFSESSEQPAAARRDSPAPSSGSPLVVLALLVALVHLSVYNLGLFDASMRRAHEWVAFGLLTVLGALVFAYQRALERRNRRLDEERRAALALVEHQALHDPLTNLANRRLFSERAERAIVEASRRRERLALVFVDLDDFKAINDRFGHPAGDEVLRRVGERLAAQVRTSDTVARVGGDEFVVLLTNVHDRETAERLAEKLRRSFDRPFAFAGTELALGASLGVSVFPEDGGDPMRLMAAADAAMYRRKGARPLTREEPADAVGDIDSGGPEAHEPGSARS